MSGDLNILGYLRNHEMYLWLYRDDQLPDVQRSLGRTAANPDLAFTWHDAAVCAQRARQQIQHGARITETQLEN
jgi:membrane peptidoglycan carboxypeptidase